MPPPSNDDFANAVDMGTVSSFAGLGDCDLATTETGEPSIASGGRTVWWKWTCPGSGVIGAQFNVTHPGDHVLCVYTGSAVNALTNATSNFIGSVGFFPTPGTTYHIQVDTFAPAPTPALGFTISLTTWDTPPNDDFANATDLAGTAFGGYDLNAAGQWNIGATTEASEPTPTGTSYGSTFAAFGLTAPNCSVWYKWTADRSTRMVILTFDPQQLQTNRSEWDTIVAVYTGSSLATLSEVIANDDDENSVYTRPSASAAIFNATVGVTYYFQVISWDTTVFSIGTFFLAGLFIASVGWGTGVRIGGAGWVVG